MLYIFVKVPSIPGNDQIQNISLASFSNPLSCVPLFEIPALIFHRTFTLYIYIYILEGLYEIVYG